MLQEIPEFGIGDTLEEAIKMSENKVYTYNKQYSVTSDLNKLIEKMDNKTRVDIECKCTDHTRHLTKLKNKPLEYIIDKLNTHWDLIEVEYHEAYNKCNIRIQSDLTVKEDIDFENYILK